MRTVWILLCFASVACVSGESRAETTSERDLYLDNSSVEEASGVYPVDDDDYSSGSGSGVTPLDENDHLLVTTSHIFSKITPTSDVPVSETASLKMQTKIPSQTKLPDGIEKGTFVDTKSGNRVHVDTKEDTNVHTEKHSENPFERKEVLAAVIAGGVIGFLFALFLILFLVYRMRKKDEGSYDLGERKPSSAAYQKAPTKEFYA
ncbi:syndecan-2 [Microcaecilia unicolor]|uniref:Syndecan n=1 Tax=Microcaecilia unicolor TaxID=1415580 RepID=A0A6P7Z8D4_9AMPH|nr:syndecan-2 [Microcaecilia unicolor]